MRKFYPLYLFVLSLTFIIFPLVGKYINHIHQGMKMPLPVVITTSTIKNTYNSAAVNGDIVEYGRAGTAYYTPKGILDIILYSEAGNIYNYITLLVLASYVYWGIFKIPVSNHGEESYTRLAGICFLFLACTFGKVYVFNWIAQRFYEGTNHSLRLAGYAIDIYSVYYITIFLFLLINLLGKRIAKQVRYPNNLGSSYLL